MSCPASTLRSRHVTGFAKMKMARGLAQYVASGKPLS